MRASNIYLLVSILAFIFGAVLLITRFYSFTSMFWVVAIIFFVIFLGFRIIEMLSDIERRSRMSYEELEQIFIKKYGSKSSRETRGRKKGSKDKKPRVRRGVK